MNVVSCHVMAYRGDMLHHHYRRSLAYRFGYAIGATVTRIVVWPIVTILGDSE